MSGVSAFKRRAALVSVAGIVVAMSPAVTGPPAWAVPGFPGVPQPPTVAWVEHFQSPAPTANNMPIPIENFGYPSSVDGSTLYPSADPEWQANSGNCNGWVLNGYSQSPANTIPTSTCGTAANANGGAACTTKACAAAAQVGQPAWWFLKGMAAIIGVQIGLADPASNNVVASQTNGGSQAAGFQYVANDLVNTVPGHFYAVSVDFAEAHCPNGPGGKSTWYDARETLYMIVDGHPQPMLGDGTVAGGVSVCNSGSLQYVPSTVTQPPGNNSLSTTQNTNAWVNTPYYYLHMVSQPFEASTSGIPLGLSVYNARAQFAGNDVAFDNPQIVDVTPQVDKSFTPSSIPAGGTATLTWTITNTNDLDAKDGFSFTDNLTAPLRAVGTGTTNCNDASYAASPTGSVTPSADGSSVAVAGSLAAGVAYCTASIQVTTDKVGAYANAGGNLTDTWGVLPPDPCTETDADGNCVTPPGGATLTVVSNPKLVLTKTAYTGRTSSDGTPIVTAAGQPVTYTIKIDNQGDVAIENLALEDTAGFTGAGGPSALSGPTCTPTALGGTLAAGSSTTCTLTYAATQADLDNGGTIDNAATASGHGIGQDPAVITSSNEATATVGVAPSGSSLSLVKSLTITDPAGAPLANIHEQGDVLHYTFDVTNTGVTTITQLAITDGTRYPYLGVGQPGFSGADAFGAITCAATTLAPQASTTCSATYAVVQDDIDFSTVLNTAQATGTNQQGQAVNSNLSSAMATVDQEPSVDLKKSHRPLTRTPAQVGDVVTFEFEVTNTGNTTLTQVGVTDSMLGMENPIECPAGDKGSLSEADSVQLEPGESITCSADYAITQADLDAGVVTNPQAQAHGVDTLDAIDSDTGQEVVTQRTMYSPFRSDAVPLPAAPSVDLVKSEVVPPGGVTAAGQTVTYSFLITNTGNVTLSDLSLSDPANAYVNATTPGFSGTGQCDFTMAICPQTALGAGQSETCTTDYVVTQADVNAGGLWNTATVSGNPPAGLVDENGDALSTVTSPPANVSLIIEPAPALSLAKTASPATVSQAGATVTYSYLVTNTGNVALTDPSITETAFSGTGTPPVASCPAGTLQPGDKITCTATYAMTLDDMDTGTVTNTATASGTDPSGTIATSEPDNATVVATQSPSLSLVKAASVRSFTGADQPIEYSFLVTNNGNTTVGDISVADTAFSGTGTLSAIDCPETSLAPGESTTCTAEYTTTQADVDAGTLTNTAVAHGTGPAAQPVASAPSNREIPALQQSSLLLVKSVSPQQELAVDQMLTYSFDVTNTGNTTLTGLSIDDAGAYTDDGTGPTAPGFDGAGSLSAITCPVTTLAPGAGTTCTATYVVTQDDLDAAVIHNAARASAQDPALKTVESNLGPAQVPGDPEPEINLAKTDSAGGTVVHPVAGETVTFYFVATNNGNVSLVDVAVTDPLPGLSAIACPDGTLAPGAAITCSATYTLTQADIDAGTVTNTATVTGSPAAGPEVTDTASDDVTLTQAPGVSLVKSASPGVVSAAGEVVTYSFLVTNTGNVTLTDPSIAETAFSGTGAMSVVSCPVASLAPGAQTTCSGTYAVTQDDVDAGVVTNTATASGVDPGGVVAMSGPSQAEVTATPRPALTLVKGSTSASITAVGQELEYTFTVTNSGNTTVHGIAVTDAGLTGTGTLSAIACPATTLAPGAQTTCAATYTTTQDDMDAGFVDNTATAGGLDPAGGTVDSNESSKHIPADQSESLLLVKSVTPTTPLVAGTTLTYSFEVTNTGNTTLTGLQIDDAGTYTDAGTGPTAPGFSGSGALSAVACPATTLAPGAQTTCTATYVVAQADVDAGVVNNAAHATAADPAGGTVTSNLDTAQAPANQSPAISLTKTDSDARSIAHPSAGRVVTYYFVAENTGNVTLTGVIVYDPLAGLSAITCPASWDKTLAPGDHVTCSATYPLTQDDIDAGSVANTATATGTPPTGADATDVAGDDVTLTPAPALSLVKTPNPATVTAANQTVTYSFLVTNTGNVTITDPSITETAFTGSGTRPVATCPAGASLAPGGSVTCTATYQVTQADIDAGTVTNTATASGRDPALQPVTSVPATAEVTATETSRLGLVKDSATKAITHADEVIEYTFTVTNEGNVTVHGISVTDADFTGTGTLSAISCPATELAPGQQTICTASYLTTQADVDAGELDNTATASGADPANRVVASNQSSDDIVVNEQDSLLLVKSVTPQTELRLGQQLTYSYEVTNTGNATATNLAIDDAGAYVDTGSGPQAPGFSGTGTLSAVACPPDPAAWASGVAGQLEPGDKITCTASYTVTQEDVNAGVLNNAARATAENPSHGTVLSNVDRQQAPLKQQPHITLTKTDSAGGQLAAAGAGNPVTYHFVAKNDGDAALTAVVVTDPLPGLSVIVCPASWNRTLAPGEFVTCSATYQLTQADIDAGAVRNGATVTGTPSSGSFATDSAQDTLTLRQAPRLALVKSATPTDEASLHVGALVTYSFLISNVGNVTLGAVSVTEQTFTGSGTLSALSCPTDPGVWASGTVGTLRPGDHVTCTATYTLTQADVDARTLTNTAVATGLAPATAKGPGVVVISDPSKVVQQLDPPPPAPPSFTGQTGGTVILAPTWPFLLAGVLLLMGWALVLAVWWRRRGLDSRG